MRLVMQLSKVSLFAALVAIVGIHGWRAWEPNWSGLLLAAAILILTCNSVFDRVVIAIGAAVKGYLMTRWQWQKLGLLARICWLKFRMAWNVSWPALLHLVTLAYLVQPFIGTYSTTELLMSPDLPWWLCYWMIPFTYFGFLLAVCRWAGHWLEAEPASLERLAAECDRAEAYFNEHFSAVALARFVLEEIKAIGSLLIGLVVGCCRLLVTILRLAGYNELTIALSTTSFAIWLGVKFDSLSVGAATASSLAILWLYLKANSPILQAAAGPTVSLPPAIIAAATAIVATAGQEWSFDHVNPPRFLPKQAPYKLEPGQGLPVKVPTPADDPGGTHNRLPLPSGRCSSKSWCASS